MKTKFRSRISILLAGFVFAIFTLCSMPMIKGPIISGILIMGVTFLFLIIILGGIRYTLSDDKLCIKIGMITYGNVNISDIVSVERSYNPISSPASSLKRLKLKCRKGTANYPYILISPVNEDEFIRELKDVNPDIQINIKREKSKWRIQDWDI